MDAPVGQGADSRDHRLHKPGVAGSSPAAASQPSSVGSVDVRAGEPNEAYHADRSHLSASSIADYLRGGPSYFHRKHITRTEPSAESDALARGTLVHKLLEMGFERFGEASRIIPEAHITGSGALSTKGDTKKWLADQDPGIIWLTPQDSLFCEEVVTQFDLNKEASRILSLVKDREISIRWKSAEGWHLKCRPDAVLSDGRVVDWKTTRVQHPSSQWWVGCRDYFYHVACAHYMQGAKAAGYSDEPITYVVISTVSPYLVQVISLPQRLVEFGQKKWRNAVADIHARTEFNHWLPEGYDSVCELQVPSWFYREEE